MRCLVATLALTYIKVLPSPCDVIRIIVWEDALAVRRGHLQPSPVLGARQLPPPLLFLLLLQAVGPVQGQAHAARRCFPLKTCPPGSQPRKKHAHRQSTHDDRLHKRKPLSVRIRMTVPVTCGEKNKGQSVNSQTMKPSGLERSQLSR